MVLCYVGPEGGWREVGKQYMGRSTVLQREARFKVLQPVLRSPSKPSNIKWVIEKEVMVGGQENKLDGKVALENTAESDSWACSKGPQRLVRVSPDHAMQINHR